MRKKKKNLDSSEAIMFYPSGMCLSERGWSKKRRKDRFFFLCSSCYLDRTSATYILIENVKLLCAQKEN
jgi:hypothetical protein